MFADLLFNRPIALPSGKARTYRDWPKPQPKKGRVNNSSKHAATVRIRIMALLDQMQSVNVDILCAEFGFSVSSANRNMAFLQKTGQVIKSAGGKRGPGKRTEWVRITP